MTHTAKVIVVSGLPGAGKSTLAESLARELACPIFSVDPIESAILKGGLPKSFAVGLAAYLVAETLAAEQLKLGLSVIIDAVNPVQEARDMWPNLARDYKATLIFIECTLARPLHQQRLAARVRNLYGFPEVTWEHVEELLQSYQPWQEERLVLDTAQSHTENIAQVLDYIQRQP